MKLPNPDHAVVDAAKVRDYLLSPEHPVGRFKATVFAGAGYERADWPRLQADLRATAELDAEALEPTPFGQKYVVAAMLQAPYRRDFAVRVVWLVRRGETFPRFVTAYPRARQ